MASDKRIPELPLRTVLVPGMILAVYDPATDVTYKMEVAQAIPAPAVIIPEWQEGTQYAAGRDVKVFNAEKGTWQVFTRTTEPLPGVAPYPSPVTDEAGVYYLPWAGDGGAAGESVIFPLVDGADSNGVFWQGGDPGTDDYFGMWVRDTGQGDDRQLRLVMYNDLADSFAVVSSVSDNGSGVSEERVVAEFKLGSTTLDGDVKIKSKNERFLGFDGFAAGHTVDFRFGDVNNRIKNTFDGPVSIEAYHGAVVSNDEYGSSGPAFTVLNTKSDRNIFELKTGTRTANETRAFFDYDGNLTLVPLAGGGQRSLQVDADGKVFATPIVSGLTYEDAQDAAGTALVNGNAQSIGINFAYNDANNSIEATLYGVPTAQLAGYSVSGSAEPAAITATDSVRGAFGKLQKWVTNLIGRIGDLNTLTTTAKVSLVAAVNELKAAGGGVQSIRQVADIAAAEALPAEEKHIGMQVITVEGNAPYEQYSRYELRENGQFETNFIFGNAIYGSTDTNMMSSFITGSGNNVVGNGNFVAGTDHFGRLDANFFEGSYNSVYGVMNHAEGQSHCVGFLEPWLEAGAIFVQGTHVEGQENKVFSSFAHAQGFRVWIAENCHYAHAGGAGIYDEAAQMPAYLMVSGRAAFNHQEVTFYDPAYIGAAAPNCAILGGINSSLAATAERSVMLGGSGMVGDEPDTVYMPDFRGNYVHKLRPIVAAGATVAEDPGQVLQINLAGAGNVTVADEATMPAKIGSRITLQSIGAGIPTIVGASGVTVRSRGNMFKAAGQWAVMYLDKIGANEWILSGDVAA